MEEHIIPADGGARLARLEAADQANEYLYQVLDIGQYMLQSGGEVSRVEDSIRRLCLAFGAERADVFTITSSIVVTIYSPAFGALTQTRRVSGQQYDLNRLEKLNQLSRRICAEHLSLEETRQAFEGDLSGAPVRLRGTDLHLRPHLRLLLPVSSAAAPWTRWPRASSAWRSSAWTSRSAAPRPTASSPP